MAGARHDFFGASIEVPHDWANRSILVFVTGSRAQGKDSGMPAASIALTPPQHTYGLSAPDALDQRVAESQKVSPQLRPGQMNVSGQGDDVLAWVECSLTAPDGTQLKQIQAVRQVSDKMAYATATGAAAGFDAERDGLLAMLKSIAI